MRVVFRVDSSAQMGVGHVMRCLSLADVLQEAGCLVSFICREHVGNITQFIEQKGFAVFRLNQVKQVIEPERGVALFHADWLGATQMDDAQACKAYLAQLVVNWLIVDHYAIDYRWQSILKPYCQKIMVIDDLADRQHICDILLDQTYARTEKGYRPLVTNNCQLLLGSQYALLRPEFASWREYSLQRRESPQLKKLLITMGGVDADNVTGQVLTTLEQCSFAKQLSITVVMGATAPFLDYIIEQTGNMGRLIDVQVDVVNMAELMANSDLAIGAAGATTWERATVGLPSITLCLAENQKQIAKVLQEQGIAIVITEQQALQLRLESALSVIQQDLAILTTMSQASIKITDGLGTQRTVEHLLRE